MRVMYVEDDPRDVELLTHTLQADELGAQLDTADSIAGARTMLETAGPDYSPYDILLTNEGLPDGSGLSLVPIVRDRGLPMAVVVLTSSGMGEAAVTALRSGANDFIVKRGDYLQRLPAVMRNAIARQAAEQVKRASPLKILYETRSILDLEQMLRHFARFAPHIHFEVVQSALEAVSKHDQPGNHGGRSLLRRSALGQSSRGNQRR